MVLGVSSQGTETLNTFIEDQGITFPILQDHASNQNDEATVYQLYRLSGGISPYPRDFIIDSDGIIRYASTEYEPAAIIAILEEMLSPFSPLETKQELPILPEKSALRNYPNPFNSSTIIRVDIHERTQLDLKIYNIRGMVVKSFNLGLLNPDTYNIKWGGVSDENERLATGIYIARLVTHNQVQTQKLVLLK